MSIRSEKRRQPFFRRAEDFLYRIYGPAQLGGDGSQPDKPASRTAGMSSDLEMREDATGRAYLVRRSHASPRTDLR